MLPDKTWILRFHLPTGETEEVEHTDEALAYDCPCNRMLVDPKYSIADGKIGCGWFIASVLPLDVELNETITRLVFAERDLYEDEDDDEPDETPRLKSCKDCGKLFLPTCNRQIRCGECARQAEKKANAKNHRMRYWQAKQP